MAAGNAKRKGFTLVELMIVVAIIGVLASVAIPGFMRFQLRTKSAEAKVNLRAIRTMQDAHAAQFGRYVTAPPSPAAVGTAPVPFADMGSAGASFDTIGWRPEGLVYFQYAATSAGGAYMLEARADLDGDGAPQVWGISHPDAAGAVVAGAIGCASVWDETAGVGGLQMSIGPCQAGHGRRIF